MYATFERVRTQGDNSDELLVEHPDSGDRVLLPKDVPTEVSDELGTYLKSEAISSDYVVNVTKSKPSASEEQPAASQA